MDLVVSDTSTLIHLAAIGRLGLLETFLGNIAISPAVWREGVEQGEGRAGALEEEALVLLDEANARGIAELYGLKKTGAIGILIRAKREGHVELLKPELDKLLHQGGFWIEERLYRQVLNAVGEGDEK